VVKGSVTISIEDFQNLLKSSEKAKKFKDISMLASKEMQVFLSFLSTRADIEKYVEEFNKQSKTSRIVFEGTHAKIEFKDENTK
tara:strand:- start:3064 stop:3315 length:252 start_codon:yes stop_codon:yes gene_type:complete